MPVEAFAPAKVNLYLHVTGRRADGYHHLLDSLIAFADVGDRLTAEQAGVLSLEVSGPEAASLPSADEDIWCCGLRACLLLTPGIAPTGAALRLQKSLPVAAGIGGGSSDAAAVLRARKTAVEGIDRRCGTMRSSLPVSEPIFLPASVIIPFGWAASASGSNRQRRCQKREFCSPTRVRSCQRPPYSPPGAALSATPGGSSRCRRTCRTRPDIDAVFAMI